MLPEDSMQISGLRAVSFRRGREAFMELNCAFVFLTPLPISNLRQNDILLLHSDC